MSNLKDSANYSQVITSNIKLLANFAKLTPSSSKIQRLNINLVKVALQYLNFNKLHRFKSSNKVSEQNQVRSKNTTMFP